MQTSYGCIFQKKTSVAAINITLGVSAFFFAPLSSNLLNGERADDPPETPTRSTSCISNIPPNELDAMRALTLKARDAEFLSSPRQSKYDNHQRFPFALAALVLGVYAVLGAYFVYHAV
jgi:hypothetical protein